MTFLRGEVRGRLLSWREIEVLQLAATGNQARETAARLGISVQTVKNHLSRSYRKLAVDCLIEAMYAMGWVQIKVATREERLRAIRLEIENLREELDALAALHRTEVAA